jgi:hypothetical protein
MNAAEALTFAHSRIRADHPVTNLHGYVILDSSNVRYVGWDFKQRCMIVWFKSGGLYRYENVPYQRAVRAAFAKSVGQYVQRKIIPNYKVVKLA